MTLHVLHVRCYIVTKLMNNMDRLCYTESTIANKAIAEYQYTFETQTF